MSVLTAGDHALIAVLREWTPKEHPVVIAYTIEPEMLVDLRAVMDRLYGGTSLTFDDRRDLARRIHNIINNAGELTE